MMKRANRAIEQSRRIVQMPYEEIGHVLGISEKAVKSLVHRARETLRERLAPFLKGEIA